tara:strand:+ start:153 stop:554 length:402 start_codon:yes stop_codon:yes gene_type:complete
MQRNGILDILKMPLVALGIVASTAMLQSDSDLSEDMVKSANNDVATKMSDVASRKECDDNISDYLAKNNLVLDIPEKEKIYLSSPLEEEFNHNSHQSGEGLEVLAKRQALEGCDPIENGGDDCMIILPEIIQS